MPVEPLCASCRFFRVKAERGDGLPEHTIGICDCPAFVEQVRAFGLPMLMEWLSPLRLDDLEVMAMVDLRVRGDFGCRHFEAATRPAPEGGEEQTHGR